MRCLECVRIDNDPVALSLELAKAGPNPEIALEATYGWYWAANVRAKGLVSDVRITGGGHELNELLTTPGGPPMPPTRPHRTIEDEALAQPWP